MNILVWQWGRRGAGPRFAACLAEALRAQPGTKVTLSLCRDAEIMAGANPPACDLPVRTYRGTLSLLLRMAAAPLALIPLLIRLRRLVPDVAICAMPGPLDLLMLAALRLCRARVLVVVHDADPHPGDGFPGQMLLQRSLCRCAGGLIVLCGHVARRLRQQGIAALGQPLIPFQHPPFGFGVPSNRRAPGPLRLLCFGRLLPYKGLDLLAAALCRLPPGAPFELRIVGQGSESVELGTLRNCPGVTVENRWVPEAEIGPLLAWSDAVILPYREASQSGVAAAALAAGRPVIATRVGGLVEQLAATPSAILCDPDPASLADAITRWRQNPGPASPTPMDADTAWRHAAAALLESIRLQLPARRGAWRPAPLAAPFALVVPPAEPPLP